jgi:hypothetical protein
VEPDFPFSISHPAKRARSCANTRARRCGVDRQRRATGSHPIGVEPDFPFSISHFPSREAGAFLREHPRSTSFETRLTSRRWS